MCELVGDIIECEEKYLESRYIGPQTISYDVGPRTKTFDDYFYIYRKRRTQALERPVRVPWARY